MLFDRNLARKCASAVTLSAFALSSLPAFAADKSAATPEPPATAPFYAAQPATEHLDLSMYARIRQEGFEHSHIMELASGLVDGIGPRLTGSPNMEKANNWTMNTLKSFGLESSHLEDWGEFGMGWKQVNSWARMVSPDTEPIWLQSAPWSPSTPGPVTGQVTYMQADEVADLDKYKGKLGGKVVLFGAMRDVPNITEPMFKRYTEAELKEMTGPEEERASRGGPTMTREQYLALREKQMKLRTAALKMMKDEGVVAIIVPSRDGGNGGGTSVIFDDNVAALGRDVQKRENAVAIPYAVTTIENYGRLYRLAKAKVPTTLEINIQTEFTGDHQHGFNTVAEIPGTDPHLKDEVVMVGGHLDSWISGTGATDNGAGSVVAMEAVRILKALGVKPRRTIRIALWSGEEQGLFGSKGYVKQHFGEFEEKPADPNDKTPSFMRRPQGPLRFTKEWEKLDAYYNLDNGTGRVRGVYAQGNYAIGPIFQQWLAPLADLGATTVTYRDTGGTDHLSFDAVGLAGFQFIQDPMDYFSRTHHSNADTYERLQPGDLKQAAVIEAIFLYNTAQREQMMPRKPFPHPEQDRDRSKPLSNLFPGSEIAPDAGKPGIGPQAK